MSVITRWRTISSRSVAIKGSATVLQAARARRLRTAITDSRSDVVLRNERDFCVCGSPHRRALFGAGPKRGACRAEQRLEAGGIERGGGGPGGRGGGDNVWRGAAHANAGV